MSAYVRPELRQAVLFFGGYSCFYCGAAAKEVDHIDAGRGSEPMNLVACCRTCNAIKGARPLPEEVRKEAFIHAWCNADTVACIARGYKNSIDRAKDLRKNGPLPVRVIPIMERDFK